MKKSHEYDSPVLSRLVSVVTVIAICVCSICCIVTASKVSTIATGGTAVAADTNNSANSNSSNNTSNTPANSVQNATPSADNSEAPAGDNADAPAADAPAAADYATILAKYTEVMDNLKANVATYDKKEFQKMDDDYDLGTIGNLVMPIANSLMTSEEDAELQHRDDYQQIPVIKNTKGCLLTDASAIKEATMTDEGGKTTIYMVLNDELDSLPAEENATSCSSTIGCVFNPLSKSSIDDIVAKFSGIATINKFTLTYTNCNLTLVFDTETGNVESLHQNMNVRIDVDAKVTLLPISGYATIVNNMYINNIQYK